MLRLVASTEHVPAEPPRPSPPPHLRLVVDDRPRQQLLRTMALVAGARRHAADRMRLRLRVGCVASVCVVAGIAALSLFQGLNAGGIEPTMQRGFAIVGLLASISLLLLIRRKSDEHAIIAVRDLDACVVSIEQLARELAAAPLADSDRVHDVRRRYVDCLRLCGAGHGHADYLAARVALGHSTRPRWRARLSYLADVYLREISIAALPLLFFVAC